MPDTLGPQAIKLVNSALAVLKDRVKNDKCPRCETFDWSVDPVLINVVPIEGVPAHMPFYISPGQIPLLQLVCKNCGYTMFHNLTALGLTAPEGQ